MMLIRDITVMTRTHITHTHNTYTHNTHTHNTHTQAATDANKEAGYLRKDLETIKKELDAARDENVSFRSKIRGHELAYAELQEVMT